MFKIKITEVDGSAAIVLPKEVLEELKVGIGDSILLTKSPEGFRISPYGPEFEEDMTAARKFMRERRDALRKLADS